MRYSIGGRETVNEIPLLWTLFRSFGKIGKGRDTLILVLIWMHAFGKGVSASSPLASAQKPLSKKSSGGEFGWGGTSARR